VTRRAAEPRRRGHFLARRVDLRAQDGRRFACLRFLAASFVVPLASAALASVDDVADVSSTSRGRLLDASREW
jgi:hypothetical protein